MNKTITLENIRHFAYVNTHLLEGQIRGIIIDFFGLYNQSMYDTDREESIRFARKGLLHVVPYCNPWAWMNRQAVEYCQDILDVLIEAYGLEDTPLVTCGASMGGLSAFIFAMEGKRTPVACVTNCPVCDLNCHYFEHPDVPRTLYSAFYAPGTDLQANISACSPLHRVAELPDIPYTLFQCMDDDDVWPHHHSEVMIPAMRQRGLQVEYIQIPTGGHCGLNEDYLQMYYSKIEEGFQR